jgi:RNA polymerase sigma-70 factor (ECF subfamily)
MALMSDPTFDFTQIYADYYPKIQRYLVYMVGEFEAEDLAQEVFVRIHQALPTFRGESQLSTWIYRIATNAAVDKLRSPSSKRMLEMVPSDGPEKEETELADRDVWTGEEALSAEEQLFLKQRYTCYCEFIEALPASYRVVVALSDLGEYAAAEIADLLGLNLDVVKIRLHRGRVKLLQELRNHCKAEDWL